MKNIKYNFSKGYVRILSKQCSDDINSRKIGRPKIRYDICLRDGKLTPIHQNLTKRQMLEIKSEIEKQGNTLW